MQIETTLFGRTALEIKSTTGAKPITLPVISALLTEC
jgi:hypothetical protein